MTDTVMIFPEPNDAKTVKAVAVELLALADLPAHVDYVMWPEVGFRVPEELAARFVAAREKSKSESPESDDDIKPVAKRGRPKKVQEGQ